jgi:hypothetical protein
MSFSSETRRSKDTSAIALNVRAQARILDGLGQQLNRPAEQLGETLLEADKAKEAQVRLGVEADGEVDVALWPVVAAGDRAEEEEGADTRGLELRLVGLEGCNDAVLGVHSRFFCVERSKTPVLFE